MSSSAKGTCRRTPTAKCASERPCSARFSARRSSASADELATKHGRAFQAINDGQTVRGTLIGSAQLASGRFAMIDDGLTQISRLGFHCSGEERRATSTPSKPSKAENQKQAAAGAVAARLPETYQWLLSLSNRPRKRPSSGMRCAFQGRNH